MTTAIQTREWVEFDEILRAKMDQVRRSLGAFLPYSEEHHRRMGVEYSRTVHGVLVPKGKEAQYQQLGEAAYDSAVAEHKQLFDKRTIILKEMINQELFYEADNIRFVIQKVAKYGFTAEDVHALHDAHICYACDNNW